MANPSPNPNPKPNPSPTLALALTLTLTLTINLTRNIKQAGADSGAKVLRPTPQTRDIESPPGE